MAKKSELRRIRKALERIAAAQERQVAILEVADRSRGDAMDMAASWHEAVQPLMAAAAAKLGAGATRSPASEARPALPPSTAESEGTLIRHAARVRDVEVS